MENKKLNMTIDEFYELEKNINPLYKLKTFLQAAKVRNLLLSSENSWVFNPTKELKEKIIALLEQELKEKAELYGIEI